MTVSRGILSSLARSLPLLLAASPSNVLQRPAPSAARTCGVHAGLSLGKAGQQPGPAEGRYKAAVL